MHTPHTDKHKNAHPTPRHTDTAIHQPSEDFSTHQEHEHNAPAAHPSQRTHPCTPYLLVPTGPPPGDALRISAGSLRIYLQEIAEREGRPFDPVADVSWKHYYATFLMLFGLNHQRALSNEINALLLQIADNMACSEGVERPPSTDPVVVTRARICIPIHTTCLYANVFVCTCVRVCLCNDDACR